MSKKRDGKLQDYINRCAKDACVSENREYDVQMQWRIIGNDLLFAIKSKYKRVRNRIEYRLLNNIKKNFGLDFHLVYPTNGPLEHVGCYQDSLYYLDGEWIGIDFDLEVFNDSDDRDHEPYPSPSYANIIDKWIVFGKEYVIATHYTNNSEETYKIFCNKIFDHGYRTGNSFDDFVNAYKSAYGYTPLEYMNKNLRSMKRINSIKAAYYRDQIDHGCGYWSVCSTRGYECPCSPSSKVMQGFDIEVWDSLSRPEEY